MGIGEKLSISEDFLTDDTQVKTSIFSESKLVRTDFPEEVNRQVEGTKLFLKDLDIHNYICSKSDISEEIKQNSQEYIDDLKEVLVYKNMYRDYETTIKYIEKDMKPVIRDYKLKLETFNRIKRDEENKDDETYVYSFTNNFEEYLKLLNGFKYGEGPRVDLKKLAKEARIKKENETEKGLELLDTFIYETYYKFKTRNKVKTKVVKVPIWNNYNYLFNTYMGIAFVDSLRQYQLNKKENEIKKLDINEETNIKFLKIILNDLTDIEFPAEKEKNNPFNTEGILVNYEQLLHCAEVHLFNSDVNFEFDEEVTDIGNSGKKDIDDVNDVLNSDKLYTNPELLYYGICKLIEVRLGWEHREIVRDSVVRLNILSEGNDEYLEKATDEYYNRIDRLFEI